MDAQRQIEKQINEDFDKFFNTTIGDSLVIPETIIVDFKNAVMALAPQFHQVHATKIKVLASKSLEQITFGDMNDIIKIVFNSPLEKLYYDFDSAIEKLIELQAFVLKFNAVITDFQEKLKMKQANLMAISSKNGNGNLRIIN